MNHFNYAAFFDLDETIISINSSKALVKRSHKTGLLGKRDLLRAVYQVFLYKYNLKDTLKIIHKMGDWAAGIKVEPFKKIISEIIENDLIPAIRPPIVEAVKHHKSKNAEIIMLSSAVSHICNPIARHLSFDHVICTVLEEANGIFTGRPVGKFCFREEKLNRLKAWCSEKNYPLEDVYYYADSIDDSPVFYQVGHPVCVSPDKKLKKLAAREGWPVKHW